MNFVVFPFPSIAEKNDENSHAGKNIFARAWVLTAKTTASYGKLRVDVLALGPLKPGSPAEGGCDPQDRQ
jgi:hypothetical protein